MDNDPNSDPRLSRRLADQAGRYDMGTPVLEVVMQRGRQRQQRRRTAVGVLSVASVCAATIVCVNVLSRPDDHGRSVTVPGADDSRPVDDTTGSGRGTLAHIVDSDLTWNRFDPDSAEAVSFFGGVYSSTNSKIAGHGPFLAWSTAPGFPSDQSPNGFAPVLWRSDDGQSWQQVGAAPPLYGTSASLAERDGTFFAYGTSATTAGDGKPSELTIASSADGGLTWASQNLALDTSALAAEHGVGTVSTIASSIATGPEGVMVVARVSIGLDPAALPAGAQDYGYNVTSTGVAVNVPIPCDTDAPTGSDPPTAGDATSTTSPGSCTPLYPSPTTVVGGAPAATEVADTAPAVDSASTLPASTQTTVPMTMSTVTKTWAELGISDTVVAALVGQSRFFFSADGVTFHEVSSPPTDPLVGQGTARVIPFGDGFVASMEAYDLSGGVATSELFQTTDGQTWSDLGPAPFSNAQSFGAMGDRLVMFGYQQFGVRQTSNVAVRDSDGTWTTIDVNDLTLPSDGVKTALGTGGVVIGPTGITMVANLYVDAVAEMGGFDVTRNGITMHADDSSGNFTFVDDTGTELGRIASYATTGALVDIDRQTGDFVVRRTADGAVAATFTSQEINGQMYPASTVPTATDVPVQTTIVPGSASTVPTTFVLHSTDGVNWSRESLSDIAGEPIFGGGGVRLTDTQIIVAANLAGQTNANGTPKQTLLIGTPNG